LKLSIGFSPCPNDTFIFDALVNGKIDTKGFEFEPVLEDVETLNEWALQGKLDITKLSFPAFFQALENYILLPSGSALGKGVGPLLVSKDHDLQLASVIRQQHELTFALPGLHTTANLLFSFALPGATKKKFMLFSEIEDAILEGKTDLGVIIHENRFTYASRGLQEILDLGNFWQEKMKVPIPLGGIAINQSIKRSVAVEVGRLVGESLNYAFSNYPVLTDYVKEHAQAMNEEVMRQHIQLYVNNYSMELGEEGRQAIHVLFDTWKQINSIPIDDDQNSLFL
jgi:1,4-dihydroxy-6-naphthoate synthase